jgi:UDP-2-acetamido-3-amino-2,3-dideoxy-glucuronate N-acetyltransferase
MVGHGADTLSWFEGARGASRLSERAWIRAHGSPKGRKAIRDSVAQREASIVRSAGRTGSSDVKFGAPQIDPTAGISERARIGMGTRVSPYAQIREYAVVGDRCLIGVGAIIDARAHVGSNVRVSEHASLVEGVRIADGVYVGAHVCFMNDLFPRAINLDGTARRANDAEIIPTVVEYGASICAGAVVRCGVTIGRFALIASGSVVTRDVAPHSLTGGSPARHVGYVCRCGYPLERVTSEDGRLMGYCPRCDLVRDITP